MCQNGALCGNGLILHLHYLYNCNTCVQKPFTTPRRLLKPLKKRPLENIVRKGENEKTSCLFKHFLSYKRQIYCFEQHSISGLQMLLIRTKLIVIWYGIYGIKCWKCPFHSFSTTTMERILNLNAD